MEVASGPGVAHGPVPNGLGQLRAERLAELSHEIRAPISAVVGLTGLLLDTALTTDQREVVESIRQAGESLLGLVGEILDLSKLEAGRLELATEAFDLRSLVDRVCEQVSPQAMAKGIELSAAVEPAVPIRLIGDPERLRQVLVNLVSNAVKFTESGRVAVEVVASAATSGMAKVRFAVTDTGIGIPPERLDAVFERFVQAEETTGRRFGGFGLGLNISRRLVELMGGELIATSRLGLGSTFYFVVELARPLELAPQSNA